MSALELGSFASRLLERRLEEIHIPIAVELWNGTRLGRHERPLVTVVVKGPAGAMALLMPDLSRLGQAYIEGDIDIRGSLLDALHVAEALSTKAPRRLINLARWKPRFHTKRSDAAAIQFHYDVSNDFYGLWLDRNMVYSCGYYRSPNDDIHTAQEQKLDHICKKLMLQPGERFLDVGCGWGALVVHAARHYGVEAMGITLSRRQHHYATARIRAEGLEDRCSVELLDYRDLPTRPTFDKGASIGMFEHVGLRKLPAYFQTLSRSVKEGGLVLNHGIASSNPDHAAVGLGGGELIERYVFPQADLPHLSCAVEHMARKELEVVDVESLRPHYVRTLRQWGARLDDQLAEASRLVGDKRCRVWRAYMAGCALAFERGWVSVYQTLAIKTSSSGNYPLPLTREHLYRTPPAVPRARSA